MNKLEELEKQYAKLGEEIEKLKKGKKEKYFIPEEGEGYYFSSRDGKIDSYAYNNDSTDKGIIEYQDISKTKEEAEFKAQKQKYELKYKRYLREKEEEPVNWEDGEQYKYYAYYNIADKKISTDWAKQYKTQGAIHTTRRESIYEFAKQIGEDNFIKYILIGEYKEG